MKVEEQPWDFYDLASDPSDAAAMRDPARAVHRRAQLAYASERWLPATFRLFGASWNARAIRLDERLGFREVARETRSFELVGDHEFVQMERDA